ncbi:MAG: glutamyl-tRNA reductase [Bdellovibrionota bacterium]
MVLGEPQILGQVKQAYEYAKNHHYISSLLDRVFQKAFRVAKRVRNETKIGDYSISLSSIAVDVSKEFFESLDNKEVLIIGAGQMAELAAKHFQKNTIKNMWIMNRSYDHAVSLAKKTNGIPLRMDALEKKISDIDVLLVSTGANQHILTADQMRPHLPSRKHKPLLCVDISVPRNLDPQIHQLEDVYLYDIDDLQNVVDKHIQIRQSEAKEAQELVEKEVEAFIHSLTLPSISQTIQKISANIDPICEQEIRRLVDQLELSQEEAEKIKKSFISMAEKLLLNPIMYIQETKNKDDRNKRIDLVQKVFMVEEDEMS